MLKTNKNLKLYYSISEVAAMFGLQETTLRYWEKFFPQLSPKKGARDIRYYQEKDLEVVGQINYLVKELGMTLPGALSRMKSNPKTVSRNVELMERLKSIRSELVSMRDALDSFSYEQVDELKEKLTNIQS